MKKARQGPRSVEIRETLEADFTRLLLTF